MGSKMATKLKKQGSNALTALLVSTSRERPPSCHVSRSVIFWRFFGHLAHARTLGCLGVTYFVTVVCLHVCVCMCALGCVCCTHKAGEQNQQRNTS
jgi:hypothetical protein